MSVTTFVKKAAQVRRDTFTRCHDGEGDLACRLVLEKPDTAGRRVKFVHDDILLPGVSIGVHRHEHDEEYYYILSGKGTMTLDGRTFEVGPGDIAAVYPGGAHGLANTGAEDLRLIVFCAAAK